MKSTKNTTANSNIFVATIHNPESVVEVYIDAGRQRVTEIKYLNYNRVKEYSYPVYQYIEQSKHIGHLNAKLVGLVSS